ncbi:hypothetical protein [uncultured Streptococcus sp.]|uniref:hypothetical protein n=1 Tax=uncultured Streptococcus sp. TaxID=83427 RepID=UPI001A38CD9B|nr:hypothetical protein [uncultured Streptococcus sp.]VTY27763.1 Uncharacterised protein [uncultured Streptococcus sp.]
MSNHKAFIFTPITTVLKEAVAASYVIGNGIETYALSEYIMNSLFLKMTGFQEQKMKCIAWEMATYDYEYRRILLQNKDNLGEYSSYKAKSAIYQRLTSLIMSLNKKFDISDIDKQKLIDDSLEGIKNIFSNSGLATWTQKKFNYFVGNVITNTEQFLMNNDKLFEDLPKEPKEPDESKYDLTNEKGEKAYKKQLEKYENNISSFYINTELNLKIKYEELYDNRNKLAHNTLSYQDNLPSLKALQNESDSSRNFFVWFFILVLIDNIFMDLFQKYMAELEENIF